MEKGISQRKKPWQNVHLFEEAALFREEYSTLECQFEQLQPLVQSFVRNMNRVRGLGLFPIMAVATATVNESARMEALIKHGIPLHDPRITFGHPDYDSELFDKIDAERMRLVAEWNASDKDRSKFFWVGASGLNKYIDWNAETYGEAIQSAMAAMLIGLWTAFESLAQDTWITAVNACPSPLASNIMSAQDSELKTGSQSKSLSYSHFVGSGFDFRQSMGTLLFAEKKVDFLQLKTIRAAYNVAFAGQFEPIFRQHQPELFQLENVRNLFVHKGDWLMRNSFDVWATKG